MFKLNKILNTGIILFLINLLYLIPPFAQVKNPNLQREINDINIFKADFSKWIVDVNLEQNIHLLIFLTLVGLSALFLFAGIIKHIKLKNKKDTQK